MITLAQLFLNGLAAGGMIAPAAMGFALILGVARFWHFAHGAVYLWAMYTGYIVVAHLGGGLLVAAGLATIVAAASSLLLYQVLYRPLRNGGATPMMLLIASLGAFIAMVNVPPLLFGFDVQVLPRLLPAGAIPLGPVRMTAAQVAGVGVTLVILVLLLAALYATAAGRQVRAVISSPHTASVIGIDVARVERTVFVIGSAVLAPTAVLAAADIGAHPDAGLNAVLLAAVACIVGGIDNVPGACLGAFVVGLAMNLGVWKIATGWQTALAFGLLVVFILVRPTGFFGRRLWRVEV